MATERQKMLSGEPCNPLDPEPVAARMRARELCRRLHAAREVEQDERRRILRELFGPRRGHGPRHYSPVKADILTNAIWEGAR